MVVEIVVGGVFPHSFYLGREEITWFETDHDVVVIVDEMEANPLQQVGLSVDRGYLVHSCHWVVVVVAVVDRVVVNNHDLGNVHPRMID